MSFFKKEGMPSAEEALPGRDEPIETATTHYVLDVPMAPPYPPDVSMAMFAMGCFWGAEKLFWSLPGVYCTAAGYSAGFTRNPTYREVCTGLTGHSEVVRVIYFENRISYETLLDLFWQGHDPTQGMRQGYDQGTQYRSGIYCFDERQLHLAQASANALQPRLHEAGYGDITTEIKQASEFYFAEAGHQQYLAKNSGAVCHSAE